MAELENLVGKPEEYIKEQSSRLLEQYGINYPEGYIFCGGSNEAYCEIADIFYDMRDDTEKSLRMSLESNNMRNYAVDVHALKSNAKSLGMKALGDVAYAHELKSKANDAAYCMAHWDELIIAWDDALSAMVLYLKTMGIEKDNMSSGAADGFTEGGTKTSAEGQNPGGGADDLMNDREFMESKENIRSLIEAGMADVARDIINELISETDNPAKIEQLKSMLDDNHA